MSDYYWLVNAEVGKNVRLDVHDLSLRDGFLVPDGYQGGVYVSLEGLVVADSMSDRRSLIDNLTSYVASILRADGTHKWSPSGVGYVGMALGLTPSVYYRLGEPSGTSAADAGPNNLTGTYAGSPTLAQNGALTGDSDTAVLFDGVNDKMTVPSNAAMDWGDTFSYVAWVKRPGAGNLTGAVVNKENSGGQLRLMNNGGEYRLHRANTGDILSTTDQIPNDSAYHMIVATKGGSSSSSCRLYRDAVDTSGTFANQTCTGTGGEFQVAVRDTAGSPVFANAYIDEVSVYNYVLTAQQVSDLYAARTASGSLRPRQRTVRAFLLPDPAGNNLIKNFQFVLVAADPLAYSQQEQTSSDASINGSPVTVTNNGTDPTYPKLRIYGLLTGGATDLRVDNETTSKGIRFDDTASIADGKYWEIDCRNETVIDSDGISRIGKLDATVSEFFTLEPGANNIDFDGTSPGGNAKGRVLWRDAWSD